jgi:hypothetical protein
MENPMSQDNENKPAEDIDFNFNFEEENNENEIDAVFSENPFDFPLSDEAGSFETGSLQNETELPESENLSFPSFSESLGEVPSTFLTNEPEETTAEENPAKNSEETDFPEINVDTDKTSGKKKEKEKKAQPEKKKKEGEPMEIGAGLCLTSSGLLLLALIAVNIILLVFQPYKELGVGFSATIYYLIGFNVIGGAGIVAVPFLFYKYGKENDLFQTMLGVSVMALSLAVIILMTEFIRYDYARKPASALPTLTPVVLSNPTPAE